MAGRIRSTAAHCLLVLTLTWTDGVAAETLEVFSQKCDAATGITVPDFDCDLGTLVPTTHFTGGYPNGDCDRPNRLNSECDPGSRFQVLTDNGSAYAVAHCRKTGLGPGQFSDIAVIQTNRDNGATCFYQALASSLDGDVEAPSKGTGTLPWLTPAQTEAIDCVRCHDNGPIVRSPYLAQLDAGPDALPGAGDDSFNSNEPYCFVGADFASWKVFEVEVDGNVCVSCHRLGVSNRSGGVSGTAINFAIRSTAPTESHKNPHSSDSPIWMPPWGVLFDQGYADSATEISNCAKRIDEDPLPNAADCRIAEYTTNATDADCDEDLNGNDNCPYDFNPDQDDLDFDGVGDVCDPDIDNDGCNNEDDQHPESSTARSGMAFYSATCIGTNDPNTYAYEGGVDSDSDGLVNCADYDDDNDGLCDDNVILPENAALGVPSGGCVGPDPCPLTFGSVCFTFIDCPEQPIWFLRCQFNPGCYEFFVKLFEVINPDPFVTEFDDISIVNQSLYLFPTAGMPLMEMGNLLAGIGHGGGGGASKSGAGSDVELRLELWRRGDPQAGVEDTYEATIAEYHSSDAVLGDLSSGAALLVELIDPSSSSIRLQPSWGSGAGVGDAPVDSDGDDWPDPFDNCLNVPNDQNDTDGDHFGNRCDADYDNDGTVDDDDEETLVRALGANCDGSFDPDLDSDDDCVIGSSELALLYAQLDGPPGPSGVICSPGQGAVCPTALPEPGSLTLLCFGVAGFVALCRHRGDRRRS